jgi:hypothetical protein
MHVRIKKIRVILRTDQKLLSVFSGLFSAVSALRAFAMQPNNATTSGSLVAFCGDQR